MRSSFIGQSVAAVAAVALAAPAFLAPAFAAVDSRDPGRFVESLADTAFASLRSGSPAAARGQFRAILAQHFDVDSIGDRLIRRQRAKISASQYAQYKASFPAFIVGAYGDLLEPYSKADLKVLRVVQRGSSAAVSTSITRPGSRASSATWTVSQVGGRYKVTNLTAAGVNLLIAQEAAFNSLAERRGFDALIAFMKSRG